MHGFENFICLVKAIFVLIAIVHFLLSVIFSKNNSNVYAI